jgi:hypothetical protein
MKTATSELSITIISIVAIGAILFFLQQVLFPDLFKGIKEDIEGQRGYIEYENVDLI